jgi:HPt (histidine-containing phosphotransfer) domain-containing protein
VEGIDSDEGLLRVAGNRRLYLKLLRQFSIQQADAATQIAEQIKSGDLTTAERTAHTVRGVSGSLGAASIQSMAEQLEKALHEATDPARVETLRLKLDAALSPLVQRLRAALGDEPASPAEAATASVDPAHLKLIAAQMARHLAEFDALACDCLEENASAFAVLFDAGGLAQFRKQVEGYAFAEASTLLEQAISARKL